MSNRGKVFKRGLTYTYYFSYTHKGKRIQVKKVATKSKKQHSKH